MKNNRLIHIVLCLFACSQLIAQEVTPDSIKKLNTEAFHLARDYSFGKALSYSYLSIQHATKNEDDASLAYSYNVLGDTYGKMQHYDKAKKYYEKALKIRQELDHKHQIVLIYHDLSRISQDEKEYEKAYEYLQKGYEVAEVSGDMQNILVMDWVKIALFQEENNYEELLQFIDEVAPLQHAGFGAPGSKNACIVAARISAQRGPIA